MDGEYYTVPEEYFKVTAVVVKLTYKNIGISFGEKNFSDKLRSDLQHLVKENFRKIVNEMLDQIEKKAASAIQDLANKIYSSCPVETIILQHTEDDEWD